MGLQVFQRNVFQNSVFQIGMGPLGLYAAGNFRFLQDHLLFDQLGAEYIITAGTSINVAKFGWYPTPNVDPLDLSAVQSFYARGPQLTDLVRWQWSTVPVNLPVTAWKEIGPYLWALTGLGSNQVLYPPIQLPSPVQPAVFQPSVFQHNVFQTSSHLFEAFDRVGSYPTGAG